VSDAAKCRRGHRMGDAYDAVMSPDFCSTSPVIRRSPSEEISTRTPPGPSISSSSSYLACGGAQGKLSAVVVSDRRLCSSLCVFVCVCACVCVCVCVCVCEHVCVRACHILRTEHAEFNPSVTQHSFEGFLTQPIIWLPHLDGWVRR
jgi:hypothetical protein